MLKFVFTDIKDNAVVFSDVLNLSVRMEEDVPADDMTAIFPYRNIDELKTVTVYDAEDVIFCGVVDEQHSIFSQAGRYLRVVVRSMAAYLLDNESVPVTYSHPTAGLMFEKHAAGYGLALSDDTDAMYFGELVVTKGMSEWQVLSAFASMCYAARPRVSSDGVLCLKGLCGGGEVTFSDEGDGIPYTELHESVRRCHEISRVNVKVINASGYQSHVDNDDALQRGVRCERYLNAVLTETPMTLADTMIENGRHNAYVMKLTLPGRQLGLLGADASVRNRTLCERDGLYVCAVRYTLGASGDMTTVELRRRDG